MAISRDDIEAKARELVGAVDETKESLKNGALLVGVGVATLIAAAFIFGRRRGSRNKTLVEVYRV